MDFIFSFLSKFYQFFTDIAGWLLDGAVEVIKSAVFFIYDGILSTATAFISSLDISTIFFTSLTTWGLLPPQLLYVINQVNLPQCLSMLFYAYMIRLTLNLIPASLTRL